MLSAALKMNLALKRCLCLLSQAEALEAQLAEATAVAVRLQQTIEELSARLHMLEQQAAAVQAPIENGTQAMDIDEPALDAAAPMQEETALMVIYPSRALCPPH